ncbi:Protein of unknown function [Gryllus bimaculatus]|nr:Protein of unknown function [Gryllus bimaculatus]
MSARYLFDAKCEKSEPVEKANGNDGNSSQNVTLSLGAILSQSISEPTPTYHQSNFFNRNTQTEIFSLSKCECCYNMKGEIFHITQWGAMSRWSDAIKYDLKEIFQALIRHTNSNKRLQESLAERERKIEESFSEIDDKIITLQEEIHSLQEQLQTG